MWSNQTITNNFGSWPTGLSAGSCTGVFPNLKYTPHLFHARVQTHMPANGKPNHTVIVQI